MAGQPSIRWNTKKQRWMAWVRMPDGSRRKIERIEQADAQRDLDEALATRDGARPDAPRHAKKATFRDVIEAWFAEGAPTVPTAENRVRHVQVKAETTLDRIRDTIDNHLLPELGPLWVDRTNTTRLEAVFKKMASAGLARSTVNKAWQDLNMALAWGIRQGSIKQNPATACLLPAGPAPKQLKALSLEQLPALLNAIPSDPRAAMWLTALMNGMRPGEMLGLRWCYLDIDSDQPTLHIAERAHYLKHKYVGQREPKRGSKRKLELHPLNVAALLTHREEQQLLGTYRFVVGEYVADGFVFPTRNGTPHLQGNTRKYMKNLFTAAGIGVSPCDEHTDCAFACNRRSRESWTTYELRHSFVSLADDKLENLRQVADVVGHLNEKTTLGYRHRVRDAIPHAVEAWNRLLAEKAS